MTEYVFTNEDISVDVGKSISLNDKFFTEPVESFGYGTVERVEMFKNEAGETVKHVYKYPVSREMFKELDIPIDLKLKILNSKEFTESDAQALIDALDRLDGKHIGLPEAKDLKSFEQVFPCYENLRFDVKVGDWKQDGSLIGSIENITVIAENVSLREVCTLATFHGISQMGVIDMLSGLFKKRCVVPERDAPPYPIMFLSVKEESLCCNRGTR